LLHEIYYILALTNFLFGGKFMGMIKDFLKNRYVIGFGAGVAASLIAYHACRSRKLRKVVVKALAHGMKLRDEVKFAASTIKEEAEDLCAEAKEKNAAPEKP
jgi:hypothetical protein